MGSGKQAHTGRARPLGEWLATQGVHLLTGGGSGVMDSVSRAFRQVGQRKGHVIGILPGTGETPHSGYPNPWVEIPIRTHLPLSGTCGTDAASRNHINVLSSDVIVALPGSHGTASEIALALHYGRPLVAWLDSREQIPGLPESAEVVTDLEQVQQFVLSHIGGSAE